MVRMEGTLAVGDIRSFHWILKKITLTEGMPYHYRGYWEKYPQSRDAISFQRNVVEKYPCSRNARSLQRIWGKLPSQ